MFRTLLVYFVAMAGTAWFATEASTRPWYNRYDYYFGPGSAPRASAYFGPYSQGYRLVPPGSANYNRYSPGYKLVPPGSYYYSPAYPPSSFDGYAPPTVTWSSGWYSFRW